ncbi:MAG: thiamine pyrophosphate-binding protein [Bacteroidetes bacterium]|nr:thiamine pyrophosphate-binding protein [Bacteroidota bacterium]
MRIADYIAQKLSDLGSNCYSVTGGGSMHLNDAFGKASINVIYCHHEQACSMAAEAEARLTRIPAVVNVTTGPGGINAINGVFGAYTDSIPMIIVSGQVKRETLVGSYTVPWRQLGDQEVDIVKMVEGVTKYSSCVTDPQKIRFHLEKAIYLAVEGRPGPVWLDIPIDIQSMDVNIEDLESFKPNGSDLINFEEVDLLVRAIIDRIKISERPVFYVGSGIHISGTQELFLQLARKLNIPVVTAWNSNDLIEDSDPLYVGRGGTIGNRSGNFVLQSADLIIVLGSRLNIRLVSYNWSSFAPHAFKVGVDIDINELEKPTCVFDIKVHSSLEYFFSEAFRCVNSNLHSFPDFSGWINWGKERLSRYPVCLPEYWNKLETVNPYCFVDTLFENLKENDTVVCADGTACVVTFQGMKVKKGQRVFHNSGCASMGYELPASIGAFNANRNIERVVCIAGDGSIMMNLQELQTISGNNLPIQIFILNNKGYHSIRQTQRSFFSDNIVGCGTDSGLSFPSFEKVASAFDFPYYHIKDHQELLERIPEIVNLKGRFICELELDLEQHFSPKLTSKKLLDGSMATSPLHDMWPFLSEEELSLNILT